MCCYLFWSVLVVFFYLAQALRCIKPVSKTITIKGEQNEKNNYCR